jgi:hypothetical protein
VHSRGELLACFLKHASDPAPISDA